MAETQPTDEQVQSPQQGEDMISCVMALEAALLPYLPARELQAINRSPHPSYQNASMESLIGEYGLEMMWRGMKETSEAAKEFQLYFIALQHEEFPTKEDILRKEIARMEEEVKSKSDLIKKHGKLILGWRKELKDQLDKHIRELEKV